MKSKKSHDRIGSDGFLFDEHLPSNIQFTPSFPIVHVLVLGESPSDTQIWQYAKDNDLVIVTFVN